MLSALIVAALAVDDVEPPAISLDFVGAISPAARSLHNIIGNQMGQTHMSHFADQCDVNAEDPHDRDFSPCFIPQAMAFDHHDGDLTDRIITTYKLFVKSDPGQKPTLWDKDAKGDFGNLVSGNPSLKHRREGAYLTQRGEYIIEYDVEDTSKNKAETIVYALLMRDEKPPIALYDRYNGVITPTAIPYGSDHQFNSTSADDVTDFYDQQHLKMGLLDMNGHIEGGVLTETFDHQYETPSRGLLNKQCGPEEHKQLSFVLEDYADIFGKDNLDNKATVTRTFSLIDSTPPTIVANNFASIIGMADETDTVECIAEYGWATHQPTDLTVTDMGCQCDTSKESRVGNELYYDAAGGECRYHSIVDALTVDTNPGQLKTTEGHPRIGTLKVRISAQDYPLGGTTNTAEATKDLLVFDITPPTLDLNNGTYSTFKTNSTVGSQLSEDAVDVTDRNAKGSARYEGDCTPNWEHPNMPDCQVSENIFSTLQAAEYLHASIIQHSAGYVADAAQLNALATLGVCTDTCGTSEPRSITATWYMIGQDDFSTTCETLQTAQSLQHLYGHNSIETVLQETQKDPTPETFVLKYSCADEVGNFVTACRTIVNQDHTRPIINAMNENSNCPAGTDATCFSFTNDQYQDEGATCSDAVDGDLTSKVQVQMGVVDLTTVGSYFVQYDCQDESGNDATTFIRTIIVLDETCPVCVVSTDQELTIEASFPFDWANDGALTCQDDMNFQFGGAEGTGGLNVTGDFHYMREDDLGFLHNQVNDTEVDVELTGTYYITYTATDGAGNNEAKDLFGRDCTKWVDPATGDTVFTHEWHNLRTITVVDTIKPYITLHDQMNSNISTMEEAQQRSWRIAGVASAVAGLFLMASTGSHRRPWSTAVPVPV